MSAVFFRKVAKRSSKKRVPRPTKPVRYDVNNVDVARLLGEAALYLEMQDVPFKPAAYERAAYAVSSLNTSIASIYREGGLKALEAIAGVGKGIAERLEQLLATGRIPELERLRAQVPVDVIELTRIEGVGPKTVRALYEHLGVRTLDELVTAAQNGKIRELPRFGAKKEASILAGIDAARRARRRIPFTRAAALAQKILERLRAHPQCLRADVAGSLRRRRETIGDLDFVACSTQPAALLDEFVSMPEVSHVYGRGDTKALARLVNGTDVDLRVVPRASYGAALMYFTGSKDHNIALRRLAQERGWKLNEYGLFQGAKRLAGREEEEVYAALGLSFIPPELRENQGEIAAAQQHSLPDLVQEQDIIGDAQVHTHWTEGEGRRGADGAEPRTH